MIHNEPEWKRTLARITELHLELVDQPEQLKLIGLSEEQIEQRIRKLESYCRHLEDEVATYERHTAATNAPAV
jgi:hypothetical protein